MDRLADWIDSAADEADQKLLFQLAPLLLFLAGFQDFITVIGLVGVFIGVVEGILIVLIFKKAKQKGDREPEYTIRIPRIILFILATILIAGAVAEVVL